VTPTALTVGAFTGGLYPPMRERRGIDGDALWGRPTEPRAPSSPGGRPTHGRVSETRPSGHRETFNCKRLRAQQTDSLPRVSGWRGADTRSELSPGAPPLRRAPRRPPRTAPGHRADTPPGRSPAGFGQRRYGHGRGATAAPAQRSKEVSKQVPQDQHCDAGNRSGHPSQAASRSPRRATERSEHVSPATETKIKNGP
jgi:hypothetical protein